MKKYIVILAFGTSLFVGCSSSSRLGYTHFDDVYDNQPVYAENRRSSNQTNQENYQPADNGSSYQSQSQNYNLYQDDESQDSYGSYADRIRRFHSGNTGFDYYSPYYSGFDNGLNFGLGLGTGIGYSGFNSWNNGFYNPFYSPSISFGWGSPTWRFGLNSIYSPYYYDPFYTGIYGWGNSFYNPYYGGILGYPYYPYYSHNHWGNYYPENNYLPSRNPNSYYGPRGGSYGNQYITTPSVGGGRVNINRKPEINNPQINIPSNKGNMNYTPKTNNSYQNTVSPTDKVSPNRYEKQNVPKRYQRNQNYNYNNTQERRSNFEQRDFNFGGNERQGNFNRNDGFNQGGGSNFGGSNGGRMQRTNK